MGSTDFIQPIIQWGVVLFILGIFGYYMVRLWQEKIKDMFKKKEPQKQEKKGFEAIEEKEIKAKD